jgi:hypothetical protein
MPVSPQASTSAWTGTSARSNPDRTLSAPCQTSNGSSPQTGSARRKRCKPTRPRTISPTPAPSWRRSGKPNPAVRHPSAMGSLRARPSPAGSAQRAADRHRGGSPFVLIGWQRGGLASPMISGVHPVKVSTHRSDRAHDLDREPGTHSDNPGRQLPSPRRSGQLRPCWVRTWWACVFRQDSGQA